MAHAVIKQHIRLGPSRQGQPRLIGNIGILLAEHNQGGASGWRDRNARRDLIQHRAGFIAPARPGPLDGGFITVKERRARLR